MDPLSIAASVGLKTFGANSPLSLSGAPVTSAANPIITTSTGPIVFGGAAGSSTSAASGLPTPNSIFGQPAVSAALGNPVLVGLAALVFVMLMHKVK